VSSKSVVTASHAAPIAASETVSTCAVCQSTAIERVDSECNLCRCRRCGHVFDSPRPCQEDIVAFYSGAEKYDFWINESAARDALWLRRLKMLLPYCAQGNLLDIGAGIGQFLHHARPYFSQIAGTEVSDSAVRIAEERYGLAIQHGRLEDLKLPDSFYDTVTLFHVLEHVPDPAELVRQCHQLLRPGGALMIAVPNDVLAWSSLLKRIGRKLGLAPFQKFSRVLGIPRAGTSSEIHLSHFTPGVLRELVTGCGFRIVKEGMDPYYASAGLGAVGHALYYALHRMLFFLFGLNGYEAIWLVARKKPDSQRPRGV
jgi:2-polyprenyl-3-methyl-5-hydroxy-6-metoxy-1,4-benzoquinol methylase